MLHAGGGSREAECARPTNGSSNVVNQKSQSFRKTRCTFDIFTELRNHAQMFPDSFWNVFGEEHSLTR